MAGIGKRTLLREVNPHLICPLCRGYLIDATTVVECLHSFCRSCILKYLNKAAHCPSCKHAINKAKPNIKADKALQDIVYKLVPGLYHKEMRKRREFYKKHPEHADSTTPEQRGEDVSGRLIFAPEDAVSLSLEYLPPGMDPLTILSTTDMDMSHLNSNNVENINNNTNTNTNTNNNNNNNNHGNNGNNRRYLQCPALVTIAHLKKFLALKYSVDMTRYTIEICHRRAPLPEHWTLMDVAYIYAWKRIAPMRFFYRVAQEEQRLEAPLHQRPSTPGLGACLPPNDAVIVDAKDDNPDVTVDRSATPGSEAKQANDEAFTTQEPSKVTNDEISSPVDNKYTSKVNSKVIAKDEASKSMTMTTTTTTTTTSTSTVAAGNATTKTTLSSELTMTSATTTTTASTVTSMTTLTTTTSTSITVLKTSATTPTTALTATTAITATTMTMATTTATASATTATATTATATTATATTTTATTTATATATTTTTCNDTNNKQIKSPIKILKNPDGRYEVLRSSSTNWNGKEQTNATAALPDVKPASPEFSVVSIGNGQNSNGVKITLKQCSPTSGTNTKKPKVISNVLLRCGQQLDTSSSLMAQQLKQKDKESSVSPPGQDKQQEKQRRKVTFVDQPTSEKTSPSSGATSVPKAALKRPAEQQDKKQFLQGFQLTAREPVPEDITLKSSVRDLGATNENISTQKKDNTTPKTDVSPKKDTTARDLINEVKEKTNIVNTSLSASNSNISMNTVAKRVDEISPENNARTHVTKSSDNVGERTSLGSDTNSSTKANINTGVRMAPDSGTNSSTSMNINTSVRTSPDLGANSSTSANINTGARTSPNSGTNSSTSMNINIGVCTSPSSGTNSSASANVNIGTHVSSSLGTNSSASTDVNAGARMSSTSSTNNSANANVNVSAGTSLGSSTNSSASANVNANMNFGNSVVKMGVYSFHSNDPLILVGAVKRKCPPGVPINDLKRKRHQAQPQNEVPRKLVNLSTDVIPVKRTSSSEHMTPVNRTSGIPDYHSSSSRPMSNVNAKASTGPILSSDTRNLLDGCGLNIPSSLSITLTSPKSPGNSLFPEINEANDSRKVAILGKMNPTITLNDRSVDPRVLKALKTGQIKMPTSPKLTIIKQTEQNEVQQQRVTPSMKRRREEPILDLSGSRKPDIHPLRIPQPVTKLKVNNKTTNNLPDNLGQVVTLMGGHRCYRAPPGSLTPAAHRVNECSPLPTRAPVYAPILSDINRRGRPSISSVFPSLQSLYVLSQSRSIPDQFQMDSRLRLPSPRSAAESIASVDGCVNPSGLSGIPSKTHLAAQCAPVKPARSSVASLAVPINKHQHSIDKPAITIRSVPSDISRSVKFQRNNEALADDSCASSRLIAQTKYPSGAENANKFSSRSNIDAAKNNDQTNIDSKNSTAGVKNESTDNLKQQHHDIPSPRVSSTASPSPPPGSHGVNSRNEGIVSHGDSNSNKTSSNADAVSTAASTTTNPPNSNADTTSCKSPASPDSSSVTVESPTSKSSCPSSTDRAPSIDGRMMTDTTTKSSDSIKPDNSNIVADGTTACVDDKSSKLANSPTDAKQQLTTEIVQKRLLAVFPSNEWANNPEAAEHLGNFLKSLNATMKSDGHRDTEESKADKIEQKTPVATDAAKIGSDVTVKPKNDVVERS